MEGRNRDPYMIGRWVQADGDRRRSLALEHLTPHPDPIWVAGDKIQNQVRETHRVTLWNGALDTRSLSRLGKRADCFDDENKRCRLSGF